MCVCVCVDESTNRDKEGEREGESGSEIEETKQSQFVGDDIHSDSGLRTYYSKVNFNAVHRRKRKR